MRDDDDDPKKSVKSAGEMKFTWISRISVSIALVSMMLMMMDFTF